MTANIENIEKTDATRLRLTYEPRVPIAIEGRSKPLLISYTGNSISDRAALLRKAQ